MMIEILFQWSSFCNNWKTPLKNAESAKWPIFGQYNFFKEGNCFLVKDKFLEDFYFYLAMHKF